MGAVKYGLRLIFLPSIFLPGTREFLRQANVIRIGFGMPTNDGFDPGRKLLSPQAEGQGTKDLNLERRAPKGPELLGNAQTSLSLTPPPTTAHR